ncbi:DUF1559 domain-containing protein [Gemmata sp. JC717]|uniref:DUF1559 domain-containing protein n=1 Tax=Gemmata algarum TaxID=2975278 RepID=UPI0021BBB2AA|nr:DUF1559 domain-containing protein [Gemmata algarum]MDY3553642.1 DUF1559 domain-containing protein [Gemmata algarum]
MRRNALSRIEVVVVLLMLAVLGALMLSLLSRAREVSARTSCQNNLKQLTLAAQNYCDTNNRLPPLVDADAGLMSVFAQLCPYIEATSLMYVSPRSSAERYHAASSVSFPSTGKSGEKSSQEGGDANQAWSVFLDPADPAPQGQRDIPVTLTDGSTGYYATGNYAVNGLLAWGKKSSAKSLEGRPALAILFAERPQVCHTVNGEVIHNLWVSGSTARTCRRSLRSLQLTRLGFNRRAKLLRPPAASSASAAPTPFHSPPTSRLRFSSCVPASRATRACLERCIAPECRPR